MVKNQQLIFATFVAMGAMVLSVEANAGGTLGFTGHTLATFSESPLAGASDTRSRIPIYQFLSLRTLDLGVQGLSIELSGVLGAHAGEPPIVGANLQDDRFVGDVLVGLIRWHDQKRRISLAAGRQYLFIGAGRAEHLDGLTITYRSPWSVDITAFGGRTQPAQVDDEALEPNLAYESYFYSNWAVGGRIRYRLLRQAIASVGFVHEGHEKQTVRQNLSFQLGYWGFSKLEAQAGGVVDVAAKLPQELWLSLTSRPLASLKLTADYSYQVPALTISKTSLFSVFATDAYHSASLGAHYGITESLLVGVGGGVRFYPGAGFMKLGYNGALDVRYRLGEGGGKNVGLRSEFVHASDQWSLQNRLYAAYRLSFGLYFNAQAYVLLLGRDGGGGSSTFDQHVEAKPLSFGGLVLAGYQLIDALSLQVAGSAFVTPLAKKDMRILARLTYSSAWSWAR
jgi:hypothetical protein